MNGGTGSWKLEGIKYKELGVSKRALKHSKKNFAKSFCGHTPTRPLNTVPCTNNPHTPHTQITHAHTAPSASPEQSQIASASLAMNAPL